MKEQSKKPQSKMFQIAYYVLGNGSNRKMMQKIIL